MDPRTSSSTNPRTRRRTVPLTALAMLALALGQLTVGCATSSTPGDVAAEEAREQVDDLVHSGTATAAAVAVLEDGEIVLDHSTGDVPPHGWQAGSVSKPVSAFAALALVEEGVLGLDAPLADAVAEPYLPAETPAADVSALSLRTVLTHTTGLPNDPLGTDRSVAYPPGERFQYSGGGYRYLQQAIEDLTGEPFDVVMERDALPRLGMTESRFTIDVDDQPVVLAAASLTVTPADLARFLTEVAGPSDGNRDAVAQLTTPQVEVAPGLSWGHGIGIYDGGSGPLYWHWGSNFGSQHALVAVDDTGDGIVLLAVGTDALDPLGDIANAALGTDHAFWSDVVTD